MNRTATKDFLFFAFSSPPFCFTKHAYNDTDLHRPFYNPMLKYIHLLKIVKRVLLWSGFKSATIWSFLFFCSSGFSRLFSLSCFLKVIIKQAGLSMPNNYCFKFPSIPPFPKGGFRSPSNPPQSPFSKGGNRGINNGLTTACSVIHLTICYPLLWERLLIAILHRRWKQLLQKIYRGLQL